MKFEHLGFKKYINDTLENINFFSPTSIQEKVIPLIKKHQNAVALAHTGTGKTHSFLLPILNNLDFQVSFDKRHVQALIIAPTRELARQIYDNIKPFQKFEPKLTTGLYIGGDDISKVTSQLEKTQPMIAIGTPTRLKELYDLNALKLTTTNYVVIDECDMIFDLGFIEEVDYLVSKLKQNVNISMFSATINDQLVQFIKKYIPNAHFIDDSKSLPSNTNIEHILIRTKNRETEEVLKTIVNSINPYLCLIFVNQREDVEKIINILKKSGIQNIGELHGNLLPRTRVNMLKKIKNNEFKYVVATDVAARGVDIIGATHVISIDLPNDLDYYIHRSGRTGRNKLTGKSYILYNDYNQNKIEQLTSKGIEFTEQKLVDNELKDITIKKKVKKQFTNDNEQMIINKYKNQKVKPGYKKKRKQEIDKLKKEVRKKHIKESISKIKKEKYKKRREQLFD